MRHRLQLSDRGLSLAALAIACVALFAALGGPSYAQRLLGAGDIKKGAVRSKHVKNNSLKGADIDERTLKLAGQKGEKGDAGQKGDTGEKGDRGDPGPRGPSNAYNSTVLRVNDITASPTYVVVDTLSVPAAGDYVVNAKLRATYDDLAIRCELGTLSGSEFTAHDEALNIPDAVKAQSAVTLALQAVISTAGPADLALRCRKSAAPATTVSLHFINMTAIEVAAAQTGL